MVEPRAAFGLITSVLLHGVLVAWSLTRVVREPEPEIDELLAIQLLDGSPVDDVQGSQPLQQTSRDSDPAMPASPSVDAPGPDSTTAPRPIARRSKPTHEPALVRAAARDREEVETVGESVPVQSEVTEHPVPPSRSSVDGHATRGQGHGSGTLDHSTYGAEIVRIIQAALDEDPVPGIGVSDSVHIVLTILPDGRLARTGKGRHGYIEVLSSSLSARETRQILRRIEQASARFPKHPRGFPRSKYVVDITLRFDG